VTGQPPAGLHLAAAPDHRRRDRHLMTEHQILTRHQALPVRRGRHQCRYPALSRPAQVTGPDRDDPRRRAAGARVSPGAGVSRQNRVEIHARLLA
jgi:hypothetical protein